MLLGTRHLGTAVSARCEYYLWAMCRQDSIKRLFTCRLDDCQTLGLPIS